MVFTTEGFLEVAMESWPVWDLNPRPLNSVQTLCIYIYKTRTYFTYIVSSIKYIRKIISTILVIIVWDFLMFYQILLSPQVKRIVIIRNKQGIYELPNDLRLTILGNWEILRRSQIFIEL